MKKYIVWTLIITTCLSMISCGEDDSSKIIEEEKEEYVWVSTHTIGDFLTEFGENAVTIDTIAIKGIVISSDEDKNITNQIYIKDETGAMVIEIEGDELYKTYEPGTEILVKCVGLKANVTEKRLAKADGSSIQFSGEEDVVLNTGETGISSAEFVTLSLIGDEYLNKYIRFAGFQFAEAAVGETYVTGGAETKRILKNSKEEEVALLFNPSATFAAEIIPAKYGLIHGIYAKENGEYVVKIISLNDLEFNISRRAPFVKKEFQLGDNTLPYQIMFPRYYDETKSYPLVIFLHGAGEKGTNNTSQMANGPGTFGSYEARTNYPAIVIFPQCPCSSQVQWSRREIDTSTGDRIFTFPVEEKPNYAMEMVIELVRKLQDEEAVDANRIYVTGLSMGGIGSFEFLYYAPDLPAAVAPMAGGYDSTLVRNFPMEVDFRIYHGSNDNVVPTRYSREMFAKMDELGYNVEYIEADGRGHEWNYVLNDPEYIEWLFSQSK